jgi:hypothetical protein
MRITLAARISPWRFAMGAAAALDALDPAAKPEILLPALWRQAAPAEEEMAAILALVQEGRLRFRKWREAGFPERN